MDQFGSYFFTNQIIKYFQDIVEKYELEKSIIGIFIVLSGTIFIQVIMKGIDTNTLSNLASYIKKMVYNTRKKEEDTTIITFNAKDLYKQNDSVNTQIKRDNKIIINAILDYMDKNNYLTDNSVKNLDIDANVVNLYFDDLDENEIRNHMKKRIKFNCRSKEPIQFDSYKIWVEEKEENIKSDAKSNEVSVIYRKDITLYVEVKNKDISKFLSFVDEITKKYQIDQHKKYETQTLYMITDGRFKSYVYTYYRNFDSVFFKEKNKLLKHLKKTYGSEYSYIKSKPIKTYTGILLTGKPGTGKTSIIQALANYMEGHIFSLNLKHIHSDDDLYEIFFSKYIRTNSNNSLKKVNKKNSIFLFEDIDCQDLDVIKKRETNNNISSDDEGKYTIDEAEELAINSIRKFIASGKPGNSDVRELVKTNKLNIFDGKRKLTLAGILNAIQGIQPLENCIIVMTTNHKDKIDPALFRDGRIDFTINLKEYDKNLLYEHLKYNYGNVVKKYRESIYSLLEYKFTGANIENICLKNETIEEALKVLKDKLE